MSKSLTAKHEIALYSLYGKSEHLKMVSDYIENDDDDWCRLTEPLEVQFTYLPDEVVVPAKIEGLEANITRIRAEAAENIARIEDQINSLRAITYQPEVVEVPGYDGEADIDVV